MRTAILTALLVALVACGSSPAEEAASADAEPSTSVVASPAVDSSESAATTLTGVLGGDIGLEGGCVWLDTPDGRVEVIWPDGYQALADPVELRDAGGDVVAAAGNEVTVEGTRAGDRVSVCQVGEIWDATTVEILDTS